MMDVGDIAVTGVGIISSIGCTKESFWKSLVEGVSGIKVVKSFDASKHKSQIASEVISFHPDIFLNPKQIRRMARVSQFAVCAASVAVQDAGLELQRDGYIPYLLHCWFGGGRRLS